MKSMMVAAMALAAVATTLVARADDQGFAGGRIPTNIVAVLPDGVRYPEGITANPANGDFYVGTFDSGPNTNKLLRYSRNGRLLATRDFGATALLGLGFDGGKVYILNMGASKVQRIAADFGATTAIEDVATVPLIGPPGPRDVPNPDTTHDTIVFQAGFPAPNALVFDGSGNLYFSDSFQGAIFRIANVTSCTTPCSVSTFVQDPLLATAGFPPFGANGIALDRAGTTMYIANTGDNRMLAMDMTTHAISVFAESIHGADGVAIDSAGRLWVAANQGDTVVALNANGRVTLRAGDFEGIRHDGTPQGLLFPASLVQIGDWMYVTNLALPLTGKAGDEPEEDVTHWTVSRFHLPPH